ncbi:MAG TPA: amino acid permease [Vicinamibacteria bacterium]|nr:amino acid permease [Vicinamibacteria bacterium]
MPKTLKRQLGLAAVMAVVMGDMLGSGIFFTPGELAAVAERPWQVYLIWGLCGLIVLCGALTLGELASRLPRAGATYHIIAERFGPLWGFVKVWMEVFVSAPGSVAGIAIVFGEYTKRFLGEATPGSPQAWGIAAIVVFATINLLGVRWGGRTQILLTGIKLAGLLALVLGSLLLVDAVPLGEVSAAGGGLLHFLRFLGLGVAAVLFTYDGWTDVSHVAGEVDLPKRNLPRGLGFGVLGIMLLYLLVNFAFLRVMPLEVMRDEGATVATVLATATFGPTGGRLVTGFIMISIFGALGGLVMTAPRLVYAPTAEYARLTEGRFGNALFRTLSYVSPRTSVPSASILFCSALSILAILFFQTFDRLVSFIVVPLQFTNILTVAAVFRLRKRGGDEAEQYLTPGYPFVPLVFILVMSLLMVNAIVFDPVDTLIGVLLTAAAVPVYLGMRRGRSP